MPVYRSGKRTVKFTTRSSVLRKLAGSQDRKTVLRSRTYWGSEYMNSKNEIFLGVSDVPDLTVSRILTEREEKNMRTVRLAFGIYCSKSEWSEYVLTIKNLRLVQFENSFGYLFDDKNLNYMRYDIHSTHTSIVLVGCEYFLDEYSDFFTKDFDIVTNEIEWIYTNDGQSIEIPLQHERMPVEEMYPFLEGVSLKDYYNDFMKSSASILLLIGPPGTGKTTFIRGLLQETNSSAIVSYDARVLEKDYVFANFIEGNKSIMVLEDADMFLKSRRESNDMMHKFLNVGDGLVTTRGKKLIFSTNLPSINDIDEALIRPGRCYDILHFDTLTQEDASVLAKKFGFELGEERKSWTVAEIFHNQNTQKAKFKGSKKVQRKVGFV